MGTPRALGGCGCARRRWHRRRRLLPPVFPYPCQRPSLARLSVGRAHASTQASGRTASTRQARWRHFFLARPGRPRPLFTHLDAAVGHVPHGRFKKCTPHIRDHCSDHCASSHLPPPLLIPSPGVNQRYAACLPSARDTAPRPPAAPTFLFRPCLHLELNCRRRRARSSEHAGSRASTMMARGRRALGRRALGRRALHCAGTGVVGLALCAGRPNTMT